ncbi:MAG: hypothetical protein PHP45_00070 [Elusimicrobiales bacterium]|nr:hypothetical protein [Elusimicrobiales bacterium]
MKRMIYVVSCITLSFLAWDMLRGPLGSGSPVERTVYSADGKFLAAATGDNTLRIYNAETAKLIRKVREPRLPLYEITGPVFLRDTGSLVYGIYDHVKILSAPDYASAKEIAARNGEIASLAVSPDGATIAAGMENGHLEIYNASDGSLVKDIAAHTKLLRGLAYSPDGKYLASGGFDKAASLWNTTDYSLAATYSRAAVHTKCGMYGCGEVRWVRFSSDGKYLALGPNPQMRTVPQLAEAGWQANAPKVQFSSPASSPDGKYYAKAGAKGVSIYSLAAYPDTDRLEDAVPAKTFRWVFPILERTTNALLWLLIAFSSALLVWAIMRTLLPGLTTDRLIFSSRAFGEEITLLFSTAGLILAGLYFTLIFAASRWADLIKNADIDLVFIGYWLLGFLAIVPVAAAAGMYRKSKL